MMFERSRLRESVAGEGKHAAYQAESRGFACPEVSRRESRLSLHR